MLAGVVHLQTTNRGLSIIFIIFTITLTSFISFISIIFIIFFVIIITFNIIVVFWFIVR